MSGKKCKFGALLMAVLMSMGSLPSFSKQNSVASALEDYTPSQLSSTIPQGATPAPTDFVLAHNGATASIYISSADYSQSTVYAGINHALTAFASDVEMVSGAKPIVVSSLSSITGMAVIAGTIGSTTIDAIIAQNSIDVSSITGKWESYKIVVVDNPLSSAPNLSRALVIIGSDKRGAIYGIYHISEQIGVSAWVWWADSIPNRNGTLTFSNSFTKTQGEPSVQYRGIFLNDESPSLSTWVAEKFKSITMQTNGSKGYTSEFYTLVFELLLRLKANYLWPAMWNNAFAMDDPLNPVLANEYGIVMGASHHEHMLRADKEWNWFGTGKWDYVNNSSSIKNYWNEAIADRMQYESTITMGMRGQEDEALFPGGTVKQNIEMLSTIIADQRQIIANNNGGDATAGEQVLMLYKEVEQFYYGEDGTSLNVPDDITLMLTDDNFGNIRSLPTSANANRSGGFGMYYHFDYVGGPVSYKWINQTPLEKIWEQMTTTYEAGVKKIWIVNVGDLKPMELPIDYFINLAYDYNAYKDVNKIDDFIRNYSAREFGENVADDASQALSHYLKATGARKAEVVNSISPTFSLVEFDEADRVLRQFEQAVFLAERAYANALPHKKDCVFQNVLYPVRASMNTFKTMISATWSNFYAKNGLPSANEYADIATLAYNAITSDTNHYNNVLQNGKWKGLMSSDHMGHTAWDSNGSIPNRMPSVGSVTPKSGAELVVRVQEVSTFIRSGSADLPIITSVAEEERYFDILNGKRKSYSFTLTPSADWIVVSQEEGVCLNQVRIGVSVDFSKVSANADGYITVNGAEGTVRINVFARMFNQPSVNNTYVETEGYVSINPSVYTALNASNGSWMVVDNLGRDGDSIKTPYNTVYSASGASPSVEYKFVINNSGEYKVNFIIAPSNNPVHKSITPAKEQMKFGAKIDNGERKLVRGITTDTFNAGDWVDEWQFGVINNMRLVSVDVGNLSAAEHTLTVYAIDPAVVIQKIIITSTSEKVTTPTRSPLTYHFMNSYFGAPHSYYKGDSPKPCVALDPKVRIFGANDAVITYNDHAGNSLGTITALASNGSRLTSEQINSMLAPTRNNYTFKGWIIDGEGIYVDDSTVFTEDTTLVAVYQSVIRADYTYHANGGVGSSVTVQQFRDDKIVIKECMFTNASRQFVHWNTSPDGSGDVFTAGSDSFSATSRELYAIWSTSLPTVTASSERADYRVNKAFDNDASSGWRPITADVEWIEFALNGEYMVDGIFVTVASDTVTSYIVEYQDSSTGAWIEGRIGTRIGNGDLLFNQARGVLTSKIRFTITSATALTTVTNIEVNAYKNWASEANGGSVTSVPSMEGISGSISSIIDGDRLDYNNRWIVNSASGFTEPVTVMLQSAQQISTINLFSVSGGWNEKTLDRQTEGTSTLGTIRNVSFEYTADGVNWLPLPNGTVTDNKYSWISVDVGQELTVKGIRFYVPSQPNSSYSNSYIRVVEFEILQSFATSDIVDATLPTHDAGVQNENGDKGGCGGCGSKGATEAMVYAGVLFAVAMLKRRA